jgi:hypothetical protein
MRQPCRNTYYSRLQHVSQIAGHDAFPYKPVSLSLIDLDSLGTVFYAAQAS